MLLIVFEGVGVNCLALEAQDRFLRSLVLWPVLIDGNRIIVVVIEREWVSDIRILYNLFAATVEERLG